MLEVQPSRILVVDDTEAIRYATARTIRSGGFDVIEAADGREALEKARLLPDLVVLDINLPFVDGREVCRRLKADPGTRALPVLHLTSTYRRIEDRVAALDDGADGYLTHPFDPRELLATIRSLLRLKAAEQESQRAAEEVRVLNSRLEDRVRERTAKLEAAIEEMEAFSYSVSHDLRAPLRAIHGFSSLLEETEGEVLSDEGKRLLGVIRGNAKQMATLIDDLLAFSRVGKAQLRIGPVDMGALARTAFEETIPDAAARSRISFECGPLAPATGDAALLRLVWSNLIGNAVKYSRQRERPEIRISSEVDGRRTLYRVADNGAGFDMAYAAKLFGVFQRLHGMSEFEGTGIGLALVRRIVHRHGGEVSAVSTVGNGATFAFSLPGA